MSPERHLLVAGVCSLAGLVDLVALGALPQWRATEQRRQAIVSVPERRPTLSDWRDAGRGEDVGVNTPDADALAGGAAAPAVSASVPGTGRAATASHPPRAAVDLSVGAAPVSPAPGMAPLDERAAPASARTDVDRLAVITFASEDVTPGPEARAALSRALAQWSGALLVEGHADPSGRAEGNEYFARVRARVVARELIRLGADPQRLTVIGRGALAPVDAGRTPAARARNRRVEVWKAP